MKIKFTFGAILLLFSLILSNNLTYAAIYVFCAAIHELGHLISAKMLKIEISEMAFDIAGAKIIPKGQISSYRAEFLLCAAGPIASVILSCLAFAVFKAHGGGVLDLSVIFNESINKANTVLLSVCAFSAIQAAINLVPIYGFDGGRMLNTVIVYLFGERAGEVSKKLITFVFALTLWMASVYLLLRVGQGLSLFSFSLCMFLKMFESE